MENPITKKIGLPLNDGFAQAIARKIDKFHSFHGGLRFGDGLLIPPTIGSLIISSISCNCHDGLPLV